MTAAIAPQFLTVDDVASLDDGDRDARNGGAFHLFCFYKQIE
jgi:hypothetical protein